MPTTEDLENAREKAALRLGGNAKTGTSGNAHLHAAAVTNHFIELLAQVDMFVPEGREKSLAVTKIEEAKMWAVKGIFSDSINYSWKKN